MVKKGADAKIIELEKEYRKQVAHRYIGENPYSSTGIVFATRLTSPPYEARLARMIELFERAAADKMAANELAALEERSGRLRGGGV